MLLAFAVSLSFGSSISVYALDDGDAISYTASHVGSDELPIFKGTGSSVNLTGVCAQVYTPLRSSGTAKVERIILNNSKEAKMIYDMVYNRGWLEPPKRDASAKAELGLDYDTTETLGRKVVDVSQISHSGRSEWYDYVTNGNGQSPITARAILDWYDNYDVSNVVVPDDFKLYYMDAGDGNQNFTLWGIEEPETGTLKLKKVSSNTSITG